MLPSRWASRHAPAYGLGEDRTQRIEGVARAGLVFAQLSVLDAIISHING
jgi:hypothetical protein